MKLPGDEGSVSNEPEIETQIIGPTIAELAASAPQVVPGGDTLAASIAVAKAMKGEG